MILLSRFCSFTASARGYKSCSGVPSRGPLSHLVTYQSAQVPWRLPHVPRYTGSRNSSSLTSKDPLPYTTEAVHQAHQAKDQPTFGVGGVLLSNSATKGKWDKVMHNNVLTDNCINDPTAHGERQIITWYYENQANLPPAKDMTIVTSLDPCLMCTGSILASGMNVAVVSLDEYAGVNYKKDQKYDALPTNLRKNAAKQFSYLGVSGERDFAGSQSSVFYKQNIPASQEKDSKDTFDTSRVDVVKRLSQLDPSPVDIAVTPQGNAAELLKRFWNEAGKFYKVDLKDRSPSTIALRAAMEAVAQLATSGPHGKSSAALLDPFNNVLLIMPSGPVPSINDPLHAPKSSPLQSAFMNLTRAYAQCRRLADRAMNGNLPHPKRCKWVLLHGPGAEATDVMDLGAFGSTLEGPPDEQVGGDSLCYFTPRQTEQQLANMIGNFPPLYKDQIYARMPRHLKTI